MVQKHQQSRAYYSELPWLICLQTDLSAFILLK